MCRSRPEFSIAYFLAKIRFDTAENEPSKNRPIEPFVPPQVGGTVGAVATQPLIGAGLGGVAAGGTVAAVAAVVVG